MYLKWHGLRETYYSPPGVKILFYDKFSREIYLKRPTYLVDNYSHTGVKI